MNPFDLILSKITQSKSTAAAVKVHNFRSPQPSKRFEDLARSIDELADAVKLTADRVRDLCAVVDAAPIVDPRVADDLAEARRRLKNADDMTNGFQMARELIPAMDAVIRLVASANASASLAAARAGKVDVLAGDLRALEQDVARLVTETRSAVERAAMKDADLDRWIDDATKGTGDDATT